MDHLGELAQIEFDCPVMPGIAPTNGRRRSPAGQPRILVISQSTALGGMELGNITRDLHLLSRLGWNATLALKVWPELRAWVGRLRETGFHIVDYSPPLFFSWDRWRVRRLKKLWGWPRFHRLIASLKPCAVLCYSGSLTDCLSPLYYASRLGVPSVLSVHHQNYGSHAWDTWQTSHLKTALYRLLGIHAVSRAAADGVVASFGDLLPPRLSPTVIYNGVDVGHFRPPTARERLDARRQLRVADDAIVIGTLCRLEPMKGVQPLLATFIRGCRADANSVLIFAGDGSQRRELEVTAREAGILDRVRFLGHRDDAIRVLWSLDVFALFSNAEGLPLAPAEAMAVGLPVLATDCGGTRELIQHGETGFLFPAGEWESAGELLDRLISSPAHRRSLGQAGRARTEDFWNIVRRDAEMVAFLSATLGQLGAHEGKASALTVAVRRARPDLDEGRK